MQGQNLLVIIDILEDPFGAIDDFINGCEYYFRSTIAIELIKLIHSHEGERLKWNY
jgi:hypothetical protein